MQASASRACRLHAAQIDSLERVLVEARSKISALKQTALEQKRQLDMAHTQLAARSEEDWRVESLKKQLTAAFQAGIACITASAVWMCTG